MRNLIEFQTPIEEHIYEAMSDTTIEVEICLERMVSRHVAVPSVQIKLKSSQAQLLLLTSESINKVQEELHLLVDAITSSAEHAKEPEGHTSLVEVVSLFEYVLSEGEKLLAMYKEDYLVKRAVLEDVGLVTERDTLVLYELSWSAMPSLPLEKIQVDNAEFVLNNNNFFIGNRK